MPKTEEIESKEKETTVGLGARAIGKESFIKNPTKRKALMLSTFMALGLATGTPQEAQADWKSRVFGSRGIVRTVVSEANRAAAQQAREKKQEIDREYREQKRQIEENIRALNRNYRQEKDELTRANDQEGLNQLEQNYQSEMEKLENLKEENEKKWQTQKQKIDMADRARREGMRIYRGW